MISFQWPWLALALPLPWLVHRFSAATSPRQEAALRVPSLQAFLTAAGTSGRTLRGSRWLLWMAALAWLLLVLAAMRPQWLGDMVEIPVSGRDLMLAVDLSASMQEQDFVLNGKRVDRLTAIKHVADDFIEQRVGDRIGLILFGERAYLQAPLTFDRKTVRTFLDQAVIGLAGKATAIGDAIGLAVKRLRNRDSRDRVLILLTDGANTAGAVDPLEAAKLAARYGLKIYTIGVGADEMLIRDFFGVHRVNPSTDLDEKALTKIAKITGGRYFRARDTRSLEKIYKLLDELEPVTGDVKRFRPRTALFFWPLGAALLIAGCLLGYRIFGRIA